MQARSIVLVVLGHAAACGPIYPTPSGGGHPSPATAPGASPAAGPTDPPPVPAVASAAADPWATQDPYANQAPRPARRPEPRPAPTKPSGSSAARAPSGMQAILDAHNRVRAKHCAPPLTWSPALASYAQSWASSLAKQGCKFEHSRNNKYGENLAAGTSGTLDGEAVLRMWYDEVKLYAFPNGGFSMETGHFTQVVWRDTTQLGCAVTSCKGLDIWVCEYSAPGNVQSMYRQQVLPTSCR